MPPPVDHRITRFLASSPGRVTDGDVAAGAGVSISAVQSQLYQLMLTHVSTLEVREDGALVYDFGKGLTPIGAKTWLDHARTVGRWLWKGFKYTYKISLAVVLVTYTIAFVVIIIAMALAASAASEDDDVASGAFDLVGAIFRGIFEFTTHSALLYADRDRYGYAYDHYEPTPPVLNLGKKDAEVAHKKGFVPSVYDFVLGPDRVEIDDRAQHRELASFVRERGGALSIADVQALSGLSRDASERLFARFVAEFDGEAVISEAGALTAQFPELQRSKTTKHDEPIVHYWDEYEPPFELTGNPWTRNLLIGLLAGFNLFCGIEMMRTFGSDGTELLLLGAVPTTIFSLFFAVPALRAPWVWWRNKEQHRHNIRKRLFKAVFSTQAEELTLRAVVDKANLDRVDEERLEGPHTRALFEKTMAELGGDVALHQHADLSVDVRRLRREIEARKANERQSEDVSIVFSTKD